MSDLMKAIAEAIPGFNGWQPSDTTDREVVVPTEHITYRFVEVADGVVRFYAHSTVDIQDVTAHAILVNYLDETAPVLMAGRMTRLAISALGDHSLLSSLATVPFPSGLSTEQVSQILSRLIVESELMLNYVSSRFPQLPKAELPYATSNMGTFLPNELIEQAVAQGDPLGALAQFVGMHSAGADDGETTIRRIAELLGESEFEPGEPAEIEGTWGIAAALDDPATMYQFVADAGLVTAVMFRQLPEPISHQSGLRVIDAGNAHADVLTMIVTGQDPRDETGEKKISQRIIQTSIDLPFHFDDEQFYEAFSGAITVLTNADKRLLDYAEVVVAQEREEFGDAEFSDS